MNENILPGSFAEIGEIDYNDPSTFNLNPTGLMPFTLNFLPMPPSDVTELNLKLRIVGKVISKYSGMLHLFDAEVNGHVEPFRVWFPITDRRLARRIARKERCRFRKRGRRDYEILT